MKRQTIHLLCFLATYVFAFPSLAITSEPNDSQQTKWADSVVETDEEGPGILIIPMKGQMTTDIRAELYEGLVDRIKAADPDLIIIEMLSHDRKNDFAYLMGYPNGNGEQEDFNQFNDDDIVHIANVFYQELNKFPQAIWVQDSSGASTVLALSWPTMYMSDSAFLRATTQAAGFMNIDAEDTFGKIRAFATVHSKVIAEYGGRGHALVRAFIDPDISLSGTWKEQKVEWEEGTNGDLVIDYGVDDMPNLAAITATELDISKGIVSSIGDILLAQGIRGTYHIVGKDITAEIIKNSEDWRKKLVKAHDYWNDALQFEQWAGLGEERKNRLGELRCLKSLLNILEKSSPVETRMKRPFRPGVTIPYLKQRIKGIEELLEDMKNGNQGGRGGGGGGRGGGGRG